MKSQKISDCKWGVYEVYQNSRNSDIKCQLSCVDAEYLQINVDVSVITLIKYLKTIILGRWPAYN